MRLQASEHHIPTSSYHPNSQVAKRPHLAYKQVIFHKRCMIASSSTTSFKKYPPIQKIITLKRICDRRKQTGQFISNERNKNTIKGTWWHHTDYYLKTTDFREDKFKLKKIEQKPYADNSWGKWWHSELETKRVEITWKQELVWKDRIDSLNWKDMNKLLIELMFRWISRWFIAQLEKQW